MKTVIAGLLLICAVLVSKLVSELLPRFSLPLIQIAMGFVLAVFIPSFDFSFDTEVFLLVFIAPLLFDDGFGMDKFALFQLRGPIMSLAIGLVFVTTLVLGPLLHLIAPSIPLAVCYAFAAALGPTDAVAVNSLSRRVGLTDRQKNLLQGEWLFNDASGIVAFQFALIFVATGTFSLLKAAGTFFLEFFGGILVGVLCMLARAIIMRYVNSSGSEDSAFKVAFELITPYLIYLVAYLLHTSGIIAVVAAAIIYSLSSTRSNYDSAETSTVSSNMWTLVVFLLNGVVFVMLGVLFVHTLPKVWTDQGVSNWWLMLIIVVATLLLYGIRFLWLSFFKTTNSAEDSVAGAVLGTVGGVVSDVGQTIVDTPYVYWRSLFGHDVLDEDLALTPPEVLEQMDHVRTSAVEAMSGDGSSTEAFTAVSDLQLLSAQERRDISRAFRQARREMRKERRAKIKARRQAKRAEKKNRRFRDAAQRANETPEQRQERKRLQWEHLRSNLVITLCGAKGVVTFAIVLSLPVLVNGSFLPKRDMLIFLAAGVILLTLLVANFLVPRLAPKPAEEVDREEKLTEIQLRIISTTIQRLSQHRTEENKTAVDQLLLDYDRRAAYLREHAAGGSAQGGIGAGLYKLIVQIEQENTFRLIEEGKVQPFFGYSYLASLVQNLAEMNRTPFLRDQFRAFRAWVRHYFTLSPRQRHIRRSDEADQAQVPSLRDILLDYPETRRAQLRRIRLLNEETLADRLEEYAEKNLDLDEEEKELALRQAQLYRHRVTLEVVTPNRPALDEQGEAVAQRLEEQREELQMWALQQERNEVHRLYEADVIDIDIMRELMHEISLRQIESN